MQEQESQMVDYEPMIPEEDYMSNGVHIGTQQKSADMQPFIYRVRNDGLYVLDIRRTDTRIKTAARFLSRFDPQRILFVSARQYGQRPIQRAADLIGAVSIAGRFMPGTLTNPESPNYFEPDVIILTDPAGDAQSLREAVNIGIPVVALCDSNNETRNVDMVLPTNNKGRRSLALVYWLLTRETLKEQGKLDSDSDYDFEIEDFEEKL